ncbi:piggyBac transposable element-derived protein 4-like [Coccinella septempunctata]|uniref:piggyBac transposable element-derived protein 4-like n=1 Tax=Coccinella septempunctata TaxID=41139 RepID=UPI001D073286|nr:piggyBac transposable element-derived protein 4-like [Coccinella septempunctata]
MSENRFRFLLRCVRFDNVETRNERRELDKLAPIRELFENFLVNFQANFIPSEFLTVDEQLLAFRGRCGFKQFIPSKPAKYGIKMFALVDAKTSYTMNLETYVGLQPEGPYKLNNSGEEIVLRLVQPIAGTNRNVTGDNWFSSVPLVEKLLRHHKLTYIGTLRRNKRKIPPEFLPHKKTEEKSSIFGFKEECTLVSYCPKKNNITKKRSDAWLRALGRSPIEGFVSEKNVICSQHFSPEDICIEGKRVTLRKNAVPKLYLRKNSARKVTY